MSNGAVKCIIASIFNAAKGKAHYVNNPLKAIWNKWPGEESIEEILNVLNGKKWEKE